MGIIREIQARQILDSRGDPTVEVDVMLEDGSTGRASVPSGASTGTNEAHELRDHDSAYGGKGVLRALDAIHTEIAPVLIGRDAGEQVTLDQELVELDGTPTKERLGANALLAVSLAVAKSEADSRGNYLFEYLHTLSEHDPPLSLPMPFCNVLNGGRHAAGSTDIQEFMIVPVGAASYSDALRMASETFHALGRMLAESGYMTTVGDEGGYAPALQNGNREALELLIRAVERAGYRPGEDIAFAIDAAASELVDQEGRYVLNTEERTLETEELIDWYAALVQEFPIISIEDGLVEDDWTGWRSLTARLREQVQLVGDDLLVTQVPFIERAINEQAATALLVKPNQVGTLTETLLALEVAQHANFATMVSHRSGETEDATIAHLAVGLGAGQIKAGSLSRSERLAKYNELLRIEELLGDDAVFSAWTI